MMTEDDLNELVRIAKLPPFMRPSLPSLPKKQKDRPSRGGGTFRPWWNTGFGIASRTIQSGQSLAARAFSQARSCGGFAMSKAPGSTRHSRRLLMP